MSIALEIDPREFASVEAALKSRPAQATRALVRAINKTLTWAVSQGLRAIARQHEVPLKALRGRRRGSVRRASRVSLTGTAWFGTRPIRASALGTPRQTRLGARAGSHFFAKAFVATMPSGHLGIFKRRDRSRLPIVEQTVHLSAAKTALDPVQAGLADRLQKTFLQELNFEIFRGNA